MNKFTIGIYDEHFIMLEAIKALLDDVPAIEILFLCNDKMHLIENMKTNPANVLVVNIHTLNISIINLISQLTTSYPRTNILVVSVHNNEEVIFKTIKAGAKGFLAKECNKNELIEALYTIRSGHDYYSKSITYLLVNKYISKIKSDKDTSVARIDNLSARQIEILKLWGKNYSNKEIADKLFISLRTVESHKNHIMQKLNLKTTVDMVKFAIKNNIIEL